jgi:riboflavin kinase/FMN adenylyltransferase
LNARSVHVGFNFRFGHKRQGDTELLREKLNEAGVELSVKDPVELNGETVSSTTIRELVRSGDVEDARRYLGRPYVTRESLQPGQGRGRSIGFPTFNFPLRRTIHPRRGVYTVWLQDDETLYQAVANFGRHPTVGEAEQPLLEVHVLESPPDLSPGDVACVHFGSFIREEKEFESIDRLKNQIDEDVDEARSDHDVLESPDVIRRSDSSDINQVVTEV